MPKAHLPLRLEAQLVADAKLYGKPLHRSAAEQIEYWADIGRSIFRVVTPVNLMDNYTGVAKLKIETVVAAAINADDLFSELEGARKSGVLLDGITTSRVKYQSSIEHPGLLEQISGEGCVAIGQFENGEFKKLSGMHS